MHQRRPTASARDEFLDITRPLRVNNDEEERLCRIEIRTQLGLAESA
jgi:hypothetical protein